ncbi:MAG: hypothetical protein HXO63_03815 [Rothia mucilaginosa]|uniref:hypothetical protein n=1 Tax=Rothia mucilaginosa TaxID=43675 RepID=UPI001CB520E4|nr:hypothetical protein [Rothia mucilaginosa]MBF1671627.1 hypothetical protein [Rothia mucilaginosa]
MSTNISRRKVVAGAAWAAPVVAASAAVPAFASSTVCDWESSPAYTAAGTNAGGKGTTSFVVPDLVDKIKFEVVGGAGGTNYADVAAGSGAKITGIIEVKPGQTVQLIGAAGGIGKGALNPAEGGEGYGNGGSSNLPTPIPASVMQSVNAIWSPSSTLKRITYSASGGGSSALVINGTPVAVAGGGGGAGFVNAGGANNNFDYIFPGAVDAGRLWPSGAKRNAYPVIGSTGGSADGAAGSAGNQGALTYSADTSVTTTVNAGEGGSAGIGGNGGSKTDLPSGKSPNGVLGYSSTNNQEIYHSSKSGNQGGDGFKGNGGDGVGSYSYLIDNNDRTIKEVVTVKATGEKKALEYSSIGHNFNGYESVISAGGGAGYGGGGSGASTSASAIVLTQKWNNNPDGLRQNVGFSQFGGGGGAGGSYVAPGVSGGTIESAGNAPTQSGTRGNGYVKVTLCKRTA